ncbi:unnamed protein product [Adineta steineri]|uniref:Uncharacterized protein n=1 Tax=Adineta steineri TaxID=433720 RepID=A0A815NLU3_9BILA|nr:unnamed protein product [Adineta steineri]
MAESSDTPPNNLNNNNSSLITTIHPAAKLGGRGTPRRKTRRSNYNIHSTLVAARTLENKLKPFRTQFQLFDQQDLCDVTILYEDGHADLQKQVHVHSTRSMSIHEVDSSEAGTQTFHIDDLDTVTSTHFFGNIENFQHELNIQSTTSTPSTSSVPSLPTTPTTPTPPTTTSSTNYFNDLQQRQFYSQPSPYYMHANAYQSNPYMFNSFDAYCQNIRQVYGGANEQSDDSEEEKEDEDEEEQEQNPATASKSKRRKRRRKHAKSISEQPPTSIIPQQEKQGDIEGEDEDEEEETNVEKSVEHLENDDITTPKTKRRRRRVRKSKKSLPTSSLTGDQAESSIIIQQSNANPLISLIDDNNTEMISSSSIPSTTMPRASSSDVQGKQQELFSTKSGMPENSNLFNINATNVLKNDEQENKEKEKETQPGNFLQRTANISADDSTLTTLIHATSVINDVDKTEDESKKITQPIISDATTNLRKISVPVITINECADNDDDEISDQDVPEENQSNTDNVSISSNIKQLSEQQTIPDDIQVNIFFPLYSNI